MQQALHTLSTAMPQETRGQRAQLGRAARTEGIVLEGGVWSRQWELAGGGWDVGLCFVVGQWRFTRGRGKKGPVRCGGIISAELGTQEQVSD